MSKGKRALVMALFVVYCLAMLYLLFHPARNNYDTSGGYWDLFHSNYNFVPFATIKLYTHVLANDIEAYRHAAIVNLFGNIGVFIPLGIFLPVLFERCRKPFVSLLIAGCVIVLIETMQLITLTGCCDIDDLILNMTGVLMGHILYRITSMAKG